MMWSPMSLDAFQVGETAFWYAVQAALSMFVSHAMAVGFLMYMDLSGRWTPYAICKKRPKKCMADFWPGSKSFVVDLVTLFIPCVTLAVWYKYEKIVHSNDDLIEAATKYVAGYVTGKVWAFAVHYILHHPRLYHIHRRHHQKPANLVASAAWEDSFVEYAIMELPSFCLTLFLFPTHWWVHLLHFALHGVDGAAGHSGFKAPGIMGYIFDGEYHYYHHAYLTVNYAELEFLDKMFGTHHSQQERFAKKASA